MWMHLIFYVCINFMAFHTNSIQGYMADPHFIVITKKRSTSWYQKGLTTFLRSLKCLKEVCRDMGTTQALNIIDSERIDWIFVGERPQ